MAGSGSLISLNGIRVPGGLELLRSIDLSNTQDSEYATIFPSAVALQCHSISLTPGLFFTPRGFGGASVLPGLACP